MADLLLADLSGLFWRAWHATANQERGSAFETTLGMISREASNHRFTAVAIDSPPYKRVAYFTQYKAQRQKPDPEAVDQLRRLKIAVAERYPILESPGLEADDMIASAVAAAEADSFGWSVTILSSDKDMLQLVSDKKRVEVKSPNGLYDEIAVEKFSGVRPENMWGWLFLCGDRVDNVPGVNGIGKARAVEILNHVGGSRRVLDLVQSGDPDQALGKYREKLLGAKDAIVISSLLTQLIVVPVNLSDIANFRPNPTPKDPLDGWFEENVQHQRDTDPGPDPEGFGGEDYPSEPDQFESLHGEPLATIHGTLPHYEPEEKPNEPEEKRNTERPPSSSAGPGTFTKRAREKRDRQSIILEASALEPRTNAEARQIASYLFDSGVFGLPNEPTALAMVMAGRQWGMGAVQSVMAFHVMEVEGRKRLTLSADTIVGRVQASSACEYIYPKRMTESEASYVAKRTGYPEPVELVYTIDDARTAGLVKTTRSGKPGMWMTHPRSMLSKTCAVHLCRALFRDIMSGVYATEEFPDD